jgi:hypothetical protein
MNEGLIGFFGVLVGAFIAVAKDVLADLMGRRRRGRFAAVRIICVLDQYVEKCAAVVADDGTIDGNPPGSSILGKDYYRPQVVCPEPPVFPDDIDWTSIEPLVVYRILSLPNQAHQTDLMISFCSNIASPPDFSELFSARREGYTDLGFEALSIADNLRRLFNFTKISITRFSPDWDSAQYLRDQNSELQCRRHRERARDEAVLKASNNGAGRAA